MIVCGMSKRKDKMEVGPEFHIASRWRIFKHNFSFRRLSEKPSVATKNSSTA